MKRVSLRVVFSICIHKQSRVFECLGADDDDDCDLFDISSGWKKDDGPRRLTTPAGRCSRVSQVTYLPHLRLPTRPPKRIVGGGSAIVRRRPMNGTYKQKRFEVS